MTEWLDPLLVVSMLLNFVALSSSRLRSVIRVVALQGALLGVMGIQPVGDVDLIRHAYVSPASQGHGVGGALLVHLRRLSERRMLVGTWAAAEWAIRFYLRHGFQLVEPERTAALLKAYWTIPDRQIATSVVLASPPFAPD